MYGGLLYIGASGGGAFPKDIGDTALVSQLVHTLLGRAGTVALSIAIALACLTSTIGVIAVIAEFLMKLTNEKIGYRSWLLVICMTGTVIGTMGVGKIVNYAMPIFLALYPVAIVLVFLGVFRKYIPNAGAYRGAILLTFIVSLFETLGSVLNIGFLSSVVSMLPLSANGFSWLAPAIVGLIAGALIDKANGQKKSQESVLDHAENK